MKAHRWRQVATAHAGGVDRCAACGVWRADPPSLRPCPGPERPSWREAVEHWRPTLFRTRPGEVSDRAQWGLLWRSRLFFGESIPALALDVWAGWRSDAWLVG